MSLSRLNNVEYIEESHTYLIDGIIVPSVSQLLRKKFPDKYKGVPKSILNQKAAYGSIVHEAIEKYEKGEELPEMNVHQKLALEQYKKLKAKHGFTVEKQEQIVCYKDKFCGRLDMTITMNGDLILDDIKTTYSLDSEYLSWQCSLYELAYEYTFNTKMFPFKEFRCTWLPKKKLGQFTKIERVERSLLLETLGYE